MALDERGLLSDLRMAPESGSGPAETRLDTRFDSAIERLWMAFQPIVWGPDRVHAYEALVRSEEPGLRRPMELITAAQRFGRSRDLARAIRRRIAGVMEHMSPRTRVFVNIDHADLDDAELLTGQDPLAGFATQIVLEVTERTLLHQVRALPDKIKMLRAMGFLLAVDDIDGSDTALSRIGALDADYVKLDISLVRHVQENRLKRDLVRSMAYVCKDMGRQLIAEGVEREAERDTLVDAGCDLFQGYLFGAPGRAPSGDDVP